ncbi:MAG: ATP-binding protein [Bacteroidia bacterium]|nr:ATP-binding protein [Bacteroidia bacterium]
MQFRVINSNIAGRNILLVLFSFSLMSACGDASGQPGAIGSPENQSRLQFLFDKSGSLVANHMNRLGLEQLKSYDNLFDTLFQKEVRDSLEIIEKNYLTSSSGKKSSLAGSADKIKELTAERNKKAESYDKLLKRAAIAFSAWLIIVIVLMQLRRRALRAFQKRLENSTIKLNALKSRFSSGEKLIQVSGKINGSLGRVSEAAGIFHSQIQSLANELPAGHSSNDLVKDLVLLSEGIARTSGKQVSVNQAILSQKEEPGQDKKETDINQLCEQYADLAIQGMIESDESFDCQVTRDLEKKIPRIKTIPEAIGSLLLNILLNSLQSVKAKVNEGKPGYKARVSISTRILPNFLQIRIKDNGTGMSNQVLSNMETEFFSTRPPEEGAGLGATVSKNIITEIQKGDILVESHEGDGTDVYLKFFVKR